MSPKLSHAEYINLDDGTSIWLYTAPSRIQTARSYLLDDTWDTIRRRLENEFSVSVSDSQWLGMRMLLCLKAAFHDGYGQSFMFGPQNKAVDTTWHSFILASTYWYREWNLAIFGRVINHTAVTCARTRTRSHSNTLKASKIVWPDLYTYVGNVDGVPMPLPDPSGPSNDSIPRDRTRGQKRQRALTAAEITDEDGPQCCA